MQCNAVRCRTVIMQSNAIMQKIQCNGALTMQLLKDLGPYIQQGLQWVQQKKAEEIQNEENLEAQIYNYMCGAVCGYCQCVSLCTACSPGSVERCYVAR